MYSKDAIFGHPLHPIPIAFPVAFYARTLLGFAIHAANGEQVPAPFDGRAGCPPEQPPAGRGARRGR